LIKNNQKSKDKERKEYENGKNEVWFEEAISMVADDSDGYHADSSGFADGGGCGYISRRGSGLFLNAHHKQASVY